MKRRTPEHDLQRQVAAYLWTVLPPEVLWSSIDHSGKSKTRQAILKGRGVKAGWPDITIYWRDESRRTINGRVFLPTVEVGHIELKAEKGILSAEQSIFMHKAERLGHWFAVCKSLEDVQLALKVWEVPTRIHADPVTPGDIPEDDFTRTRTRELGLTRK